MSKNSSAYPGVSLNSNLKVTASQYGQYCSHGLSFIRQPISMFFVFAEGLVERVAGKRLNFYRVVGSTIVQL